MNMENKWNYTTRRRKNYSNKNLFQCHLIYKAHMDRP